jgi:hypothetical protein
LALHKRVLGYADPMSAGQLRTIPVFVGNFRPPDAQFVSAKEKDDFKFVFSLVCF